MYIMYDAEFVEIRITSTGNH